MRMTSTTHSSADLRGDPTINEVMVCRLTFEWELPWADFKKRMDIKQTRYIALDTQGTATFTCRSIRRQHRVEAGCRSTDAQHAIHWW